MSFVQSAWHTTCMYVCVWTSTNIRTQWINERIRNTNQLLLINVQFFFLPQMDRELGVKLRSFFMRALMVRAPLSIHTWLLYLQTWDTRPDTFFLLPSDKMRLKQTILIHKLLKSDWMKNGTHTNKIKTLTPKWGRKHPTNGSERNVAQKCVPKRASRVAK